MNGPQVLEVVLLGQDENHGVVAVASAGVNLKQQNIVIALRNKRHLMANQDGFINLTAYHYGIQVPA